MRGSVRLEAPSWGNGPVTKEWPAPNVSILMNELNSAKRLAMEYIASI